MWKSIRKLVIVSETQSWTFRQLDQFANRIADLFHSHGFKKGDVIGLLLENRAEFVGMWLGLSKLGITIALFNNAINKPVRNSAAVGNSNELYPSRDYTPSAIQHPNHHDRLMYIYTSGTTGLPKAAVISHSRTYLSRLPYTTHWVSKARISSIHPYRCTTRRWNYEHRTSDVFGATVAIRKKFSASGYFADCVRFNCTPHPESDYDRAHQIRLVFGNGLRPQSGHASWSVLIIPRVGEFYGATEGNANILYNDSRGIMEEQLENNSKRIHF
ncbi:unnamed protein product [Ceratitis capitata]|uniref:Long-chain-fatty-acid--CoA ligase n=1 Tax=Ceratitis capitata TaxID=7213 RepID=A0A811UXP3_CERCA|nr:unnamed protein product [Ceratitis capitata]